jgi:hypothetical protein
MVEVRMRIALGRNINVFQSVTHNGLSPNTKRGDQGD